MKEKKQNKVGTIIFLHLVKTAGTTLNQILEREYSNILSFYIPKESKELFENFKKKLKNEKVELIRGHFEFGWHIFLSQPFVYFTIFRDPIDRVLSEYYYILGKPDHPFYKKIAKKNVNLADFVKNWNAPNLQTRKISGITFSNNSGIPLLQNIEINDNNMLEIAKENLDKYFAVVGLTENFDETLILLKRELGWGWPFYTRQNVTASKVPRENIQGATIEIIREYNQLDIELYEYARQIFYEEIRQQGQSFFDEVEKFKKLNQVSNKKEKMKLPGWKGALKKTACLLRRSKKKNNKNKKKDQTVIFLHLPKTGGKTVNSIIEREYSPANIYSLNLNQAKIAESISHFQRLPIKTRKKIKVLKGHMDFGLHTFLPNPSKYITIIRDPVERVISNYYFVIGDSNHPMHEFTKKRSLFKVTDSSNNKFNNGQVRMLAGMNFKPEKPTKETLEIAKNNLKKKFIIVGLTERFDETLILFKKELGWDWPFYYRKNVTREKVARENIPESTIKIIKKYNQLDIELYEYAKKLFEEKIHQQEVSFFDEVEEFKKLNKVQKNDTFSNEQIIL